MSFMDDAKGKLGDAAEGHEKQIDEGVDKAGDAADEKTGGTHGEQIDKGADKAKKGLEGLGDDKG